jgi:uncharacterized protein (TIGR01244 family)
MLPGVIPIHQQVQRMKVKLLTILILLSLTAAAYAQQDESSIRNFYKVNEKFCTGGQPKIDQIAALKNNGVKAIINLRPASEFDAREEEAKAKELGIRYFNIPVVYDNPKEEQATEFLRLTDDPKNRPAFIHCAAGIRAAAFWMIRRLMRDGWSVQDAEAEAEKAGLRHVEHLIVFANAYIDHHQADKKH